MFSAIWKPKFKTEDGNDAKVKYYRFIHGVPDCETTQHRAIFYLNNTKTTEDEYVTICKINYLILLFNILKTNVYF